MRGTLDIVREKRSLAWRAGILACLFPVLLLLPTPHLHPVYEHDHEAQGAHRHASVIHADFFPTAAHDHGHHHNGHHPQDDTSSESHSQIRFPTLLPKSVLLLTRALQKVSFPVLVKVPDFSSPLSFFMRVIERDHSPPVQDSGFPFASLRSPPHCA